MPHPTVPADVRTLADQLARPRPMRRGSVSARYVKWYRADCPCGARADARHGPYDGVSRVVKGRAQSRWLDAEHAPVVRRQVEAGQALRREVETSRQAGERSADGELDAPEAASKEAAPKGASQRPSTPRSSARSKRRSRPGAADRLDVEAVEIAARDRARHVATRAVAQRFNADHADHASAPRPCRRGGKPARSAGRRAKRVTLVLGARRVERAYYHCDDCPLGCCPRDAALDLEGTSLSPAVTRTVGQVGAMVSFEDGHDLLHELAGVEVPTTHVERAAEALGREIAGDERRVVEPPPPDEAGAPPLYLGLDGTGVPVRASAREERAGKQPDGSSKTREVKLCAVWSAEGRDEEGAPVRDAGSVSYSAAIASAAQRDTDAPPSACAARVVREATRRGFARAERRVVLGDGAPWIWPLASEPVPDARQIVDRFHAKQHLSDAGKATYGATSVLGRVWSTARHDELDEGKTDDILAALAAHAATTEEVRKCLGSIDENRARMGYAEFRAAGLCTSTGVVEAACKVAIGTRLKRTGMHWTVAGADAIIALRCCKRSGRFEDFWERRSSARAAVA